MDILNSIKTNKVQVKLIKEQDGYSLSWSDHNYNTGWQVGQTTPTEYKYPSYKHRRRFKKITDKQILNDIFQSLKRTKWLGLNFSKVSSIVYKHLQSVYGEDATKYYETKIID